MFSSVLLNKKETAKFVMTLVSMRKFHAQLFICNPTPAQTSLILLSDRQ